MLRLLAKTMCRRTQLTMPLADPEEVAGVRTPAPWKITNSIGLYTKKKKKKKKKKKYNIILDIK